MPKNTFLSGTGFCRKNGVCLFHIRFHWPDRHGCSKKTGGAAQKIKRSVCLVFKMKKLRNCVSNAAEESVAKNRTHNHGVEGGRTPALGGLPSPPFRARRSFSRSFSMICPILGDGPLKKPFSHADWTFPSRIEPRAARPLSLSRPRLHLPEGPVHLQLHRRLCQR